MPGSRRPGTRIAACALAVAGAALPAACSDNAENAREAEIEAAIRAHYEAQDVEVVTVELEPDAGAATYSGAATIVDPDSSERVRIACAAEPGEAEERYSWECRPD